ncbi:helix-turn-helix domain-containing protein [Tetragenococcus halophilus]|uniref:helix-turn-helix domain-containing protein n=1 Tax=Tetragenococcus halophilus TaxID=51669 RepID=UPI001F398806|nr:helix-turn-helix transcriptional regulator [Tetragenococcus halophilus]MCF1601687.1 helix-turn-helix domain-containing protein [Tetragenococcus halophilus]MDN6167153.1 helix-turn-helix domain-containing protein [Tetragenococcus koreensis]MDN6268441.1 helix-turn-helix domain-containing protein [Tetragenococcus koreensis]
MHNIGSLLKYFRTDYLGIKITLTELSKKTGLSQPFLSMVENGRKSLTVPTFFNIIEGLSIFGENLFTQPIEDKIDEEFNRISWIKDMLTTFLEDYNSGNYYNEWIPKDSLSKEEVAIFEASVEYLREDKDRFPSEFLKEQKSPKELNKEDGDLTNLLNFISYSLDLNVFFDEAKLKHLKLKLDELPVSKDELEIIKNSINGIRYSRK